MDVVELTKNLSQYSPVLNDTVNQVDKAVKPVSLVIISIFFLIEMDSWYKYMKQEGGGITRELWMDVAFKYILAYLLVMLSGSIFDMILEIVNMVIRTIDGVIPAEKVSWQGQYDQTEGWFFKNIFKFVGGTTEFVAKLSARLIIYMRALEMYLLKAVGSLLIAFFMSDATRSIAINILKYFGAAAFQGLLLLLIVRFYPVLVTEDLMKVNMQGDLESWGTALASIGKGIIFIVLLWGSQRKAKQLLSAM
ncbi:type IV secretion system protein [Streptococcus suis]|uniref:type IV secretion system protein n=1 Tax=Streptococcus suis TaxID=1307 RepID=UPI0004129DEE|nr:type IV secretion system protein [Streptococcus suis]